MADNKKLGPEAEAAERILAGITERTDAAPDEPYEDDSFVLPSSFLRPVTPSLEELALPPED